MSQITRQQNLYGITDWQSTYTSFQNVDFSSYDFQTLRKSMTDYLQLANPENFNDYINSSEFIALIDLISFMGQSLSFRFDLNARENFIQTAQSRDSVTKLAAFVNYQASRNLASNGFLKISSITTDDTVLDSLGTNLSGITINWNDRNNSNWQDQWNSILNAALTSSQSISSPGNTNTINGILTSEYGIETASSTEIPIAFNATVDNTNLAFEAVNPSSINSTSIFELDPRNNTLFNLLYQNDNLGYSSNNTGYFLYFKQGSLTSETFQITTSLPNRTVDISATGVNNTDVWLYQQNTDGSYTQWTQVESIYGENVNYNNLSETTQQIYSVSSRSQDAISLVFGDGVFSQIPVGTFICYTRTSSGTSYRINPSEMSNIQIDIPYTSKLNRTQNLTVTVNLLYTVANSATRESLSNIKANAPQSYYSQNRMVNGQDYNTFPFTQFSSIVKIKAINRTSSGVSRYLDVIDPTSKYSSTNIFCSDGFIYEDPAIIQNTYSYNTVNDLASAVEGSVIPSLSTSPLLTFFYENYSPLVITNISWNLVQTNNNSSSGYIKTTDTNILVKTSDSQFSANDTGSLFLPGALLQFTSPSGYAFDVNNNLTQITNNILLVNQKTTLFAAVVQIINYGVGNTTSANGINADNSGGITLSQKIPTGAILTQALPIFVSQPNADIIQSLITNLSNNKAVSLQYNPNNLGLPGTSPWFIDNTLPINYNLISYSSDFLQPSISNDPTQNWLLAFVPGVTTNTLTVYQRNIDFYFGSELQTTFYFDAQENVNDPETGQNVNDAITILQTNPLPGSATNTGFSNDISFDVFSTVSNTIGQLDTSRVKVSYSGLENNGWPENPYFFSNVVGASTNYIFLITDNIQNTTTLLNDSEIIQVATPSVIDSNLYLYPAGQIIFSQSDELFYQIQVVQNIASKSLLNNAGDQLTYSFFNGRDNLKFQYVHNAATDRRIDPSPSNLIDIYILEQSYANDYQAWIVDSTGQVQEPVIPTTNQLATDFSTLENYKMVSDQLIYNPVSFKPLFGSKADPQLQASFVVVQNPNTNIGAGEIKTQLITNINNFFQVGNWDFGETFYFSELASYIHTQMSDIISSVNLVPSSSNLVYGNLQTIAAMPYEIFTSAATVDNVTVVTDLTNLNLRIGSSS